MFYIKLSDNTYGLTQRSVRETFPNTSFPRGTEDFEGYARMFFMPAPNHDRATHQAVEKTPILVGERYEQQWEIEELSSGEKAAKTEEEAVRVRQTRDEKLAACDWHGLSDNVMSEAMTEYRQALRDVPEQAGFPHEVTWPDSP
jgi:hypothetical protein|tara:strand:+ start:27 stop:458 length:432 start_codon:yes stop_codon:yes gene_type:complete